MCIWVSIPITLHYVFHYILIFRLAKDPVSINPTVANNDPLQTATATQAHQSEALSIKVTATATNVNPSEALPSESATATRVVPIVSSKVSDTTTRVLCSEVLLDRRFLKKVVPWIKSPLPLMNFD